MSVEASLASLFQVLPLERAMPNLVVKQPADLAVVQVIQALAAKFSNLGIQAGLWLYADCLELSHPIAQALETPVGSYWHGILHRREGDFWNSKYWLRRARMVNLDLDYDPAALVDAVEAAKGVDLPELVELQRAEWMALISYCLENSVEEI